MNTSSENSIPFKIIRARRLYPRGPIRDRYGPPLSIEAFACIHDNSICMAKRILKHLPWFDQSKHNTERAMLIDYAFAQRIAHQIEKFLNPTDLPFGSEERRLGACNHRSDKVQELAARFLTAFDKVMVHYDWQTETSRAASQELIKPDDRWLARVYCTFPEDAVMEPIPPAIDGTILLALLRASHRLCQEIIEDLPQGWMPKWKHVLAKAVLPVTTGEIKWV